ncbi:MAG: hypothetical protein WCO86_08275 [Planctomycetota bacterium]|jgi:hypothetical protein
MSLDRGVGFFEAWVSVFDGALFWMTFVCIVVAAGETESGSNGVDLSVLRGNVRNFLVLLSAPVTGAWLFQFRILGVAAFDGARLVSTGAIPHQV